MSRRSLVPFLLLAVAGCGTTTTPPVEEGQLMRAPSCDQPQVVTLVDGTPSMVDYDLRTAPHSLTTGCNDASDAGQVVYEIVVPGTGPHAITANTGVPGTDRALDTIIGVRYGSCPGTTSDCYDDYLQDTRARADFLANGGDHVFLIVTSYTRALAGPTTMTITSSPNSPPTIDSANVLLASSDLLVDVSGGDVDGNAWGVVVRFHGPAGELIDIDGDHQRTASDVLRFPFARSVSGATTFVERARMTLTMDQVPLIGGATTAYVRTEDEPGAVSEADIRAPVRGGSIALHGDVCDDTHVCSEELTCSSGSPHTCEPNAMRAAECSAAMPLAIPPVTSAATTASVMGVLMSGNGQFQGACAPTLGLEDIYTVTVPDMIDVDLVLTTDNPGTQTGADTVIYVRSDCVEPASSMDDWCNDDEDTDNAIYLSRVVIEDADPGSYSVFVEAWNGLTQDVTLRYELTASLRPVLPSGSACDPMQVRDRCAGTMPCSATARTCP